MVSLYFFLSPQRCRISHRRQCASLLHWNLTIPPSLWPDRELRKSHCPCLALTPPPVAIRHLPLQNRYRPDGFMVCSRKLDQTGMYLKNEYSVFKEHPVSCWPRRRTLVVLAGLPAVRFDFSVFYAAGLGQKIPRWFPNEACDACRSTKCFLDFLRNRRQFRNNAQKIIFDFLFAWLTAHQKIIRADMLLASPRRTASSSCVMPREVRTS